MKIFSNNVTYKTILLTAVVALVAGCGSAQVPSSSSGAAANVSHRVGPLDDPSTEVDIQNNWTAAIAGSGSADCWTISPSLPIVGAGDTAGPITLTYTPLCPTPSALPISYGPAATTGERCTFNVSYTPSGFSFSVTQSDNTACKIEYPPNTINAIFVYAQKPLGSGNAVRSARMQ
jgi:hypothetical protein